MGQLKKGKVIIEYRGVNYADDAEPSWRELMRETGRSDHSIKKWYELYAKHPVYEDYKRMASEKVVVKLWVGIEKD